MKITKTTVKSYDVKFYPNAIDWTFGTFREKREKHGQSTKRFERCFCCGHKFSDDEKVVFITVSGKGNLFGCSDCLKKEKAGDNT